MLIGFEKKSASTSWGKRQGLLKWNLATEASWPFWQNKIVEHWLRQRWEAVCADVVRAAMAFEMSLPRTKRVKYYNPDGSEVFKEEDSWELVRAVHNAEEVSEFILVCVCWSFSLGDPWCRLRLPEHRFFHHGNNHTLTWLWCFCYALSYTIKIWDRFLCARSPYARSISEMGSSSKNCLLTQGITKQSICDECYESVLNTGYVKGTLSHGCARFSSTLIWR